MKKRKKKSVKYEIILTKNDTRDFDRDKVSSVLNLQPIDSEPPRLSKGKVYFEDFGTESGFTVIHQEKPPHRFMIHATWCYGKDGFNTFDETLRDLVEIISDKKDEFVELCSTENLTANLQITISSKTKDIPYLTLSQKYVSLFSSLGLSVEVLFDFE